MREKLKLNLPTVLVSLSAAVLFWYLGRAAWLFIKYNWNAIKFPFMFNYGEGPILDQVMRLARFQNIYLPNTGSAPYSISNYPPLYHILQIPFAWAFGPAYWYGRAISTLSILAAALFVALTLYTITKDRLASLFGGLTLLAVPYIVLWSPFFRVDSLALGLSWAGLFVVVRWPKSRNALVVSAVLLAAAIYTRQSYGLAAPSGAFVWLAKKESWPRAFKLAAWVAGLSLGLFLIINILTRGGFFFNIITANVNWFFWQRVWSWAGDLWQLMPYLVVSSGIFILAAGWFKVDSFWLVAPYLLASSASALTIGKTGSDMNYLYELCAGLSFTAGAVIAAPGKRWWGKALLMLFLAGQTAFLFAPAEKKISHFMTGSQFCYSEASALLPEIEKTDGPVLADEFIGLLPLAGRQIYLQPFETKQLVEAGIWNERPLIDELNRKKFPLILIYAPNPVLVAQRWTPAQLRAIEANYGVAGKYMDTLILKPF